MFYNKHRYVGLPVLLLIFANFMYTYINKTCPFVRDDACLNGYILPNLKFYLTVLFVDANIFYWIIYYSLKERSIHWIFGVWTVVNFFYLAFFYDTVTTTRHYGGYLGMILLVFFILSALLYFVINIFRKCCRKNWKMAIMWNLLAVGCLLYLFYSERMVGSCRGWEKGLYG